MYCINVLKQGKKKRAETATLQNSVMNWDCRGMELFSDDGYFEIGLQTSD